MLVIFDCDGVLVDSELLAAQVFSDLLAELNMSLSPQRCYELFHGHTLPYCYQWLEAHFKQSLPSHFDELLATATRQRFAKDLRPVDGVVEVLETLQAREITFCVASNGEHKKIDHSLNVTGLSKFFPDRYHRTPRRFSREDVDCGKPAPDLFLHAAEVVGVPPRFCTVVEDSPSGFAAAKAAGMRLLCYTPQKLEGEHTRVHSMAELMGKLTLTR